MNFDRITSAKANHDNLNSARNIDSSASRLNHPRPGFHLSSLSAVIAIAVLISLFYLPSSSATTHRSKSPARHLSIPTSASTSIYTPTPGSIPDSTSATALIAVPTPAFSLSSAPSPELDSSGAPVPSPTLTQASASPTQPTASPRSSNSGANAQNVYTVSASGFELEFSDRGLATLRRTSDLYPTNYILANNPLGDVIVTYRLAGENEYRHLRQAKLMAPGQVNSAHLVASAADAARLAPASCLAAFAAPTTPAVAGIARTCIAPAARCSALASRPAPASCPASFAAPLPLPAAPTPLPGYELSPEKASSPMSVPSTISSISYVAAPSPPFSSDGPALLSESSDPSLSPVSSPSVSPSSSVASARVAPANAAPTPFDTTALISPAARTISSNQAVSPLSAPSLSPVPSSFTSATSTTNAPAPPLPLPASPASSPLATPTWTFTYRIDPPYIPFIASVKVSASTLTGRAAQSSPRALSVLYDDLPIVDSKSRSGGYFSFSPKKGTVEWVQYDFPQPASATAIEVYWLDDSALNGPYKVPVRWRLLYRDARGNYLPVKNTSPYTAALDRFNRLTFEPVTTTSLRLEVEQAPDYTAGLYEWSVETDQEKLRRQAWEKEADEAARQIRVESSFRLVAAGDASSHAPDHITAHDDDAHHAIPRAITTTAINSTATGGAPANSLTTAVSTLRATEASPVSANLAPASNSAITDTSSTLTSADSASCLAAADSCCASLASSGTANLTYGNSGSTCGSSASPSRNVLLWTVLVENLTDRPLEIADLGLPLPFNTQYGWDKDETYNLRVIRHFLVAGHGSFVFCQRTNAEPPYLLMIPTGQAAFEYFDDGGGRGILCPYLHASWAFDQVKKEGGRWRFKTTALRLSPHGQPGDHLSYTFKFMWAEDGYQSVRDLLYEEGKFDIQVVPGMVVPENLEALIAVRTKHKDISLVAEFPAETTIEEVKPIKGFGKWSAAAEGEAARRVANARDFKKGMDSIGCNQADKIKSSSGRDGIGADAGDVGDARVEPVDRVGSGYGPGSTGKVNGRIREASGASEQWGSSLSLANRTQPAECGQSAEAEGRTGEVEDAGESAETAGGLGDVSEGGGAATVKNLAGDIKPAWYDQTGKASRQARPVLDASFGLNSIDTLVDGAELVVNGDRVNGELSRSISRENSASGEASGGTALAASGTGLAGGENSVSAAVRAFGDSGDGPGATGDYRLFRIKFSHPGENIVIIKYGSSEAEKIDDMAKTAEGDSSGSPDLRSARAEDPARLAAGGGANGGDQSTAPIQVAKHQPMASCLSDAPSAGGYDYAPCTFSDSTPGKSADPPARGAIKIKAAAACEIVTVTASGTPDSFSASGDPLSGGAIMAVPTGKIAPAAASSTGIGGGSMPLEFFVTEDLETLIKKRANFLTTRQQHKDPSKWYYGVYSDWDMKNRVLRSPDDRDGLSTWLVDACDDAGNARPAYVASKNVYFPKQAEVNSVDLYIEHYLWGGMQQTDDEPYPFAIYGIPNWKVNRESPDPGRNGQKHIWRIYDYPHIVLLYYRMYQVARLHPEIKTELAAEEYLRRAYRTAIAYFTVPLEVEGWSAYETPTMNEIVMNDLLRALEREGWKKEEAELRQHWEKKVRHFVEDDPYLFGSEFAFDSTGFEATGAMARYAMEKVVEAEKELKRKEERRSWTGGEGAEKRAEFENLKKTEKRSPGEGWVGTTTAREMAPAKIVQAWSMAGTVAPIKSTEVAAGGKGNKTRAEKDKPEGKFINNAASVKRGVVEAQRKNAGSGAAAFIEESAMTGTEPAVTEVISLEAGAASAGKAGRAVMAETGKLGTRLAISNEVQEVENKEVMNYVDGVDEVDKVDKMCEVGEVNEVDKERRAEATTLAVAVVKRAKTEGTDQGAKLHGEEGDEAGLAVEHDRAKVEKFMEKQVRLNVAARGWLETAYYYLGSDYRAGSGLRYTLSYMSQMGGWSIMDYALYWAGVGTAKGEGVAVVAETKAELQAPLRTEGETRARARAELGAGTPTRAQSLTQPGMGLDRESASESKALTGRADWMKPAAAASVEMVRGAKAEPRAVSGTETDAETEAELKMAADAQEKARACVEDLAARAMVSAADAAGVVASSQVRSGQQQPFDYLRLGYASYLSSWALVNSGRPETGYGYWFPAVENDGGAGGGFEPLARARGWLGKWIERGAWYYSAEEDVGYCGAIRTAATVVADDPVFGLVALGGKLEDRGDRIEVVPRDGLRTRFHLMMSPEKRLHVEFQKGRLAKEKPVVIKKDLSEIIFEVEERVADEEAVSGGVIAEVAENGAAEAGNISSKKTIGSETEGVVGDSRGGTATRIADNGNIFSELLSGERGEGAADGIEGRIVRSETSSAERASSNRDEEPADNLIYHRIISGESESSRVDRGKIGAAGGRLSEKAKTEEKETERQTRVGRTKMAEVEMVVSSLGLDYKAYGRDGREIKGERLADGSLRFHFASTDLIILIPVL